jgi:hypothetical protein
MLVGRNVLSSITKIQKILPSQAQHHASQKLITNEVLSTLNRKNS